MIVSWLLPFGMADRLAAQQMTGGSNTAAENVVGADAGDLNPDPDPDDPLDEEAALPPPVFEPQDPLNDIYAAVGSAALDEADRKLIQDPLREVPDSFQDRKFQQRLEQDEDWRLRDDNAFEPLGIRRGSFVFFPELHSYALASDNIFASETGKKGDVAGVIAPSLRVRSDWNVHELELFVTGEHRAWENYHSEDTTEYEARMRGRVDITSRTSIDAGIRYQQDTEGRGSNDLPSSAASPSNIYETEVYGQLDHRFNRLGFRFRGSVQENAYEDVRLNDGTVLDSSYRDYQERTLGLRSAYEFSPRLTVFADGERNWRRFHTKYDPSMQLQGSDGWLAAVGANVALTSSVDVSGRIGYARALPNDGRLVPIEGVVLDGSLIWRPTRLITATLSGETSIEETTQTGTLGSLDHKFSFDLRNEWTRRLSSEFVTTYELSDYAGIDQVDKKQTLGLGLEYLLSRSWLLEADYRFEHSQTGSSEYDENTVRVGFKARR